MKIKTSLALLGLLATIAAGSAGAQAATQGNKDAASNPKMLADYYREKYGSLYGAKKAMEARKNWKPTAKVNGGTATEEGSSGAKKK